MRLPLLVISPFAKVNYVSGSLTDTTSVLKFVEDNSLGGARTGTSSFDNLAGSMNDMFTFGGPAAAKLILRPSTGAVVR